MEEGGEGMDSLFEGMVLFNPSSQSDSPPHHDHHQPPPSPSPSPSPPLQQLEQPPSLLSPSTSLPLDENLFSDLTLITPNEDTHQKLDSPEQYHLSSSNISSLEASSSITRQVSRKKKKSSIKIGYARDTPTTTSTSTSLPDEPSPSPSTLQTHKLESGIQEKSDLEDAQVEIPSQVPLFDSESKEKSDLKDAQVEIPASMPITEAELLERNNFEDINEGNITVHGKSALDVGTSGNYTEEKLEEIRCTISEKLEGIRAMAVSVSATRKELAKKRRKAVESVSLASWKYKELEKELEEACEAEDFEKAERVSDSLASAEEEKDGFLNALRDAEAECDSVELKTQEVFELQIAAEAEAVSLLEQFAKDAADDGNLVLKNAEEVSLKETNEWLSSVEALEVKKMELEIESHLTNDARLGLNDSIEHVIEDDRREQDLLCKKQDILKEELEILLALVRQKEAEIVENNSHIQVVEKRISDAISGFQDIQSSIDTKCHDLQSALARWDSESEVLSNKKKEIDDFVSRVEKRGGELKQLASVSMDEAKACQELVALRKSLALPILKCREVKLRLAKTEANILMGIHNLRQEVSAARASLQELSSARSTIQQEVTSVKQRIFFIDKRSPELEAEKRVAAVARNFKEAGRIASEVKALGVEKERLQTKMEADILQLGKIEEEIDITVKNLNEKEELILLKEKEAAKSGCERLRLVSATAMAERSAALELGDLEEANTLLAEAEAADTEAKKLQQAHDLKEEEFENTAKRLISIELIANPGRRQLAEMAASISDSAV